MVLYRFHQSQFSLDAFLLFISFFCNKQESKLSSIAIYEFEEQQSEAYNPYYEPSTSIISKGIAAYTQIRRCVMKRTIWAFSFRSKPTCIVYYIYVCVLQLIKWIKYVQIKFCQTDKISTCNSIYRILKFWQLGKIRTGFANILSIIGYKSCVMCNRPSYAPVRISIILI